MTKSKRKQQEEQIRAVSRRCRGPLMYDDAREQEGFSQWRALEAERDDSGARKMIERLVKDAQEVAAPGLKVHAPPMPEEGDWPALRRAALPLIRLRGSRVGRGCGADLNDQILDHPFDGADHETACPDCGVLTSWKAPVFY